MTFIATKNEASFVSELATQLEAKKDWEVQIPASGSSADIIVKDKASDKRIFIEVKNAKGYGELPISSVIPLAKLVADSSIRDTVLLISFSALSSLLADRLKELKVETLQKPTVDQVVQQINYAFAS